MYFDGSTHQRRDGKEIRILARDLDRDGSKTSIVYATRTSGAGEEVWVVDKNGRIRKENDEDRPGDLVSKEKTIDVSIWIGIKTDGHYSSHRGVAPSNWRTLHPGYTTVKQIVTDLKVVYPLSDKCMF